MPSSACSRRFKRRSKTQTVLPSSVTAAMLFWAEGTRGSVMRSMMEWRLEGLLASGQILMRKVDGGTSLATPVADQPVPLAA